MQQLKQLQEQQKLIGAIALDIRKSLKFQDILATSVKEVRQLLKADRVLVYQFTHHMRGKIVAESVLPQWTPALELEIEDTYFQQSQEQEYCQGKIWAATNIYEAGLSDRHIQFLEQFQVKANLVVPILLENQETPAVVWGLFIVHQCSAPRQWQTFEVEFLNQLTVQLAIAIQQAQLHHNLQTLKAELEAKVEERTIALQESDRRFQAIFNNTFQFTGLLTPDGILLEANQTALSFGGLKLEDVINRPFWEAHWWTISPQIQEKLKQAIARAAQGEFVRYEVDVLGANNRVATIDFSLRPLQNEMGQVVLLIPEGRDITERKATELALYEREVMLYLIGDNLPNGAVYRVIRELDGSDRFSYLSGGIQKLMEVKVEDALRDSSLLYSQFIPEDIPRLQTAVAESALNLSVFDIQLRIRTPSGQLKWFHFRSTPRQLKDGRVAWDGLVVDVTDLKRSEETLRKSQALLEESQQVAGLGNWEFELGRGKITWSKGLFDLFNREPTLVESNYEENLQLYHPEDREKLHQVVERAIATGESYKEILRVPQLDGSNRYFEGIGHAEFNADGQVIRLYGTAQDVTGREVALRDRQKAEETLRQSEERWQLAIAGTNEAIWDWDISTNQTFRSERWFTILGYEPNEISDRDDQWSIRIHPDDYTRVMAAQEAYLLGQVADYNVEYRLRCKDDSYRWVRSRAKAIWNEQGNPVRLVGSLGDISERKQAEEKLRESEERLQLALEASGDALWDWNILTGEVYYSPRYLEILGYSFDELPQDLTTWKRLVHPDDLPWVEKILADHLKDNSVPYKFNYRLQTKSGECKWIANYGKVVMRDGQGKPLRMTGTHRDITDVYDELRLRKQTEAALARSEEQLRLTLEFNHIGIWDWNLKTNEVIWNDNHFRLLGLEPETLTASYQLWRDRVHLEDVDRIEQAVLNALAQHTNFQGEYRVIYPNGRVYWLIGKGRGIYNEAGEPVRMLGIILDISDRKQAEAALQESETRFQAFMNNSPVLAWITDPDGRVLYLNQTYLRTFKLLPEQVIGQSIFDLYPDEIARQHFDRIQTVIQTNQVIEAIEVASRPDGTLGEFLVYKFPILGLSAQKLVGRVAIDITERKILEQELAHKQKLLDTFINNAPVGITILDRQLRYSLINEALAEINGIPAAAHIGKRPWEIVPDVASKQEQVFQHVLRTGESILDLEISGETPKFPGVIRTWLASYFPIQSEADQPISMGVVVVEISDRKRAEQMLELQAVIARNMAEGICLIHVTDSVFVYANPKFEQMFGYEPGELINQHVSIVNYGDEHTTPEEVYQAIRTAVLQHGEANYEVYNVKKDGTPFWCRAKVSVFEHPEYGSVLVAVQQDITEHKQTQEKIKASLKEKEVLLKEIHHRVKNNLGIVSSLLQMQCRRTQDPLVTAILRDSQNRIASIALVHEKLYRSEDLADIDFAQYIPDLTTHLFDSYNVSSSQIQLKIQVDNASLDIETAIPCGLIINELVSNALKYAFVGNRRGEIEVKFYQESESTLTLIIRDNGIGLPKNFDSKKAKTLGITLIQGLVKQLRGKLEIDSHQGTQFKITFTNSQA
ncbi:PAS domain-containing protein [uncultured Nostoc sp.]|uniref:PAS domain-containing protein n=1 Tax=uncultured Nostoc sp. TaxID=340711 RepID=UPI0035C9C302